MTTPKLIQMRLRVRALQQKLRRRQDALNKCCLRLALEGVVVQDGPYLSYPVWKLRCDKQSVVCQLHIALNAYQLAKIHTAIKKRAKGA